MTSVQVLLGQKIVQRYHMPDRNWYLQQKHLTCRPLTWCTSSIKVMVKKEAKVISWRDKVLPENNKTPPAVACYICF
ncbi:unnamed protein product [Callosobruchus maculatus]|uniref:Uncharacterized protein n=1 Tax=Callosobruchus maculatus TaxID=64391 RepID=A0A653CQC6_CALMS|nr:unnamed protein product [Callosobruchus maculatus]